MGEAGQDRAFHNEFEPEFDMLPAEVQDELFAEAAFVELFGPLTGRPHVNKLHGSGYANMKELRFEAMMDVAPGSRCANSM